MQKTKNKRNETSYKKRVLQIEHGSFTRLVFSIHGGMSRECRIFYNRLAKLVADKRDITHSVAISWIRTKLSFALSKTSLFCFVNQEV